MGGAGKRPAVRKGDGSGTRPSMPGVGDLNVFDHIDDMRVVDSEDDDPVLIGPDGEPVETWREGYPYDERMSRDEYDRLKRPLQIELLKLQYWVKDAGQKILMLFEGRDAAGKGSTIKRFMEHLNPRGARVVAVARRQDRLDAVVERCRVTSPESTSIAADVSSRDECGRIVRETEARRPSEHRRFRDVPIYSGESNRVLTWVDVFE